MNDTSQFELNRKLYEAARACDAEEVERLLRSGADPLACADESFPDEPVLGELFCDASDDEELAGALPQMLELFYAYGMDLAGRKLPTGGEDSVDPLWDLAFCHNEHGLRILKTMLEHGLAAQSAEALIEHIFIDMEICSGCETEDAYFMELTVCALKMVMLTASYPHIIDTSDYICNCIELSHNSVQRLPDFRSWNSFSYHIDKSTCDNLPRGLRNASLTIRDIRTGEAVWAFRI